MHSDLRHADATSALRGRRWAFNDTNFAARAVYRKDKIRRRQARLVHLQVEAIDLFYRHRVDFRNVVPRFTPEARKENLALVDLLRKVAERTHTTPAQISLAWLLAQKPWIVPIPGTTKLHRLEENIGAAAVALNIHDLADIGDAASKIQLAGDRLPAGALAMTGR